MPQQPCSILSPVQRYQAATAQAGFASDPAQQQTLIALQTCYQQLEQNNSASLLARWRKPQLACQPLYIWGPVGRGKTWLMDCFYQSVSAAENKQTDHKTAPRRSVRLHYYRFMKSIHAQLKTLQGKPDPLKYLAKSFSKKHQLLCLDEFFVSDIADAMILGRLLDYFFQFGVTIICTSNVKPELLYRNGLQRERFLPAIELIQSEMNVLYLDGAIDHRVNKLPEALSLSTQYSSYFLSVQQPLMQRQFFNFHASEIDKGTIQYQQTIQIEGRSISAEIITPHAIWFDFMALCSGPRSQNDYIALAEKFKIIYISGIPVLGGELREKKVARGTEDAIDMIAKVADRPFIAARMDDEARRLISLVDELYDQNIQLVISAEVALERLYCSGGLEFEFQRTHSRLIEMQSEQYQRKTASNPVLLGVL
ncbi:cell division protein ZapE [Pelagibaculum spongiae]|nr:cell division protein ZapE [Pelagibaculum spongiae]